MDRLTLVGVSTKSRFRRPVPKSYSYRYEVGASAGPPGAPLVTTGAAIIETRYRGRSVSWNVSTTMFSEAYLVNGTYVAPAPENPLTYPERTAGAPAPGTPVKPAATLVDARVQRTAPRADPAESPTLPQERIFAFGRKFAPNARRNTP